MNKFLNAVLISIWLLCNVGQICASQGFEGPLDGNTFQESTLIQKIKTNPRYALPIAGLALTVAFGYYLQRSQNFFSNSWNAVTQRFRNFFGLKTQESKEEKQLKREKLRQETEAKREKLDFENQFQILNNRFNTMNPEDENYDQNLDVLLTDVKKLLNKVDQFLFTSLYNNVFDLSIAIIDSKRQLLRREEENLQFKKEINKELRAIQSDMKVLDKKNLDQEKLSELHDRIKEVKNLIQEKNLGKGFEVQIRDLSQIMNDLLEKAKQ